MRKSRSSKTRMENLVVVYKTQDRQEEAIELFDKLGLMFLSKGRETKAKKLFEAAGFYSESFIFIFISVLLYYVQYCGCGL